MVSQSVWHSVLRMFQELLRPFLQRHAKMAVDDIPPHVQRLFDTIVRTFGDELTIELFISLVEIRRGKKLHIVYCEMKTGTTGYVLGLSDCDVIFLRHDLTPERARLVLFHECAHLLLKHVEHTSKGCHHLTFDTVAASPSVVLDTWFHSNDYDRPGEYDAEAFATLMNRVLPVATESPNILAKAIMGYRREK